MPIFKRTGNTIFGVQFNSKEQKIIEDEIRKQTRKASRQYEINLDCSVLWMLHEYFGFGQERLRKAWELFYAANREYEKFYELDLGEGTWICRKNLKDYGCDVEQWYKEEGLL